jgi:hypothetical protein
MSEPCHRCSGLLVLEHLSAGVVGGVEEPLSMLRCLNYGFRWDSLIGVHRDQHERGERATREQKGVAYGGLMKYDRLSETVR